MNHNYVTVIACVLLSISGYSTSFAQSTGPEFLSCSSNPDSLCVQDEGVRLPANNQVYLGEDNPDATSCSVHVTQKKRVRSHCGDTLQYEVLLFIGDTSPVYRLKSLSTVVTDSLGEAELTFNTEEAVDEVIRTSGIPYGASCMPLHLIKWVVLDSCNSISICEQRIHLYDCNAIDAEISSSPYTVGTPEGCQINLYAVDYYIGGVDDCTLSDQFDFSFEENVYKPDTFFYCPNDFWVEVPWKIWIADGGYDVNCDGQIDWNEKNKYEHDFTIIFIDNVGSCCEPDFDFTLTGVITRPGNVGINQVYVSLLRPGSVFPTYVTDMDGRYSFQLQLTDDEATIEPIKNDGHKNGVSTLDLVRIQQHLLGIKTFTSPFQYIAADANNSQNISAIDLIELRKLVLGIYLALPANMSWRFVPQDYIFPDTLDPGSFPETISFSNTLPANADFYGIKIGDVNGPVPIGLTQLIPRGSPPPPYELITDQQHYLAAELINVPIRFSSQQNLTGFQFTMNALGMEVVDIIPGVVALSEEHVATFNDKMSISWFDVNTIDVSAEDVLFTLQMRATTSGNLGQALSINSEITEAEIYLNNEETLIPFLKVQDNLSEDKFLIMACAPNPWKEETMIQIVLPESNQVTFTLYDLSGREIQSTTKYLKSGHYQHQLRSSDFQARGILLLEIKTSKHAEVIKMMVEE